MVFKKSFFLCKALLLLTFLVFGCNSSPKNFTDLLYKLTDIDENARQTELENWLNFHEEFPIVDNSDVYFIYKEKRDIPIFLSGDMNRWSTKQTQLLRIVGTDYYFIQESYPANSSFDYSYFVDNKFISDPLNPRESVSSQRKSSFLILSGYEYPTETLIKRNYVYTKLDTLKLSKYFDDDVYIFKHNLAGSNAPILIFLSGDKYLVDLKANITIDNLINSQLIESSVALFLPAKIGTSLFDDVYLKQVFDNVLPLIQKQYNLVDNHVAMGGISDDGVKAFYALKNHAEKLDAVFAQSANFEVDSLRIIKELQNVDFPDTKVFYNFGTFEGKDSSYAKMNSFLQSKSANYGFGKYNEGKSNFSLRGHLDEALLFVIGKKLIQ